MPVRRVPLDELLEAALAGDLHNGTLMVSVLAAARLRERGWAGLRSVHEPWPTRPPGRREPLWARVAGSAARGGCRWVGRVPVRRCAAGGLAGACCGPVLAGERPAATAAALMRSRYTAYAVGDGDHLFRSWHARTRPDDVEPDPRVRWVGLTCSTSSTAGRTTPTASWSSGPSG